MGYTFQPRLYPDATPLKLPEGHRCFLFDRNGDEIQDMVVFFDTQTGEIHSFVRKEDAWMLDGMGEMVIVHSQRLAPLSFTIATRN